MSVFKSAISALALASLAGLAAAQDVNITFYGASEDTNNYGPYREGFALVQHDREFIYQQGEMTLIWPEVSSAIDPATVTFQSDRVGIIEQNFDFDLLTPAKLLEKSVGETVDIVRINPATGEEIQQTVKILSANQGVVMEVDGKIEVLRDDQLPTRVIFNEVPKNLRAKPTLSMRVLSERSGTREARLSYLSGGLSWRGDYVALFDETAESMDLQGWATLKNNTSTTFENATLNLAAGEVNASSSQENWNTRRQRINNQRNRSRTQGGTEASSQERIGDAYIYTLPMTTTVASNQTKQVAIVEADNVRARRAYVYRATGLQSLNEPQNASVHIEFSNSRESGLAAPLPAGIFRVYTKDSTGRAQFIGEDAIPNSPGGSDLSVRIGEAFDITVDQTAVSETGRKFFDNKFQRYEVTMRYVISNAKNEPATVTIRQPIWRSWLDETVTKETHKHKKRSRSDELSWDIDVPAEGRSTLEFTVVYSRRKD